jgi:putative FmdB family regulatory protein
MPRYLYECESCEEQFVAFHSISENKEECDLCGHKSVKKMLGKPIVIKKKQNDSKAIGATTREYIEANREVLKEMKEEASNGFYEQS